MLSIFYTKFVCIKSYVYIIGGLQGSTNCEHGDERARNVHAKKFSRARNSIKIPLSSTPMLL